VTPSNQSRLHSLLHALTRLRGQTRQKPTATRHVIWLSARGRPRYDHPRSSSISISSSATSVVGRNVTVDGYGYDTSRHASPPSGSVSGRWRVGGSFSASACSICDSAPARAVVQRLRAPRRGDGDISQVSRRLRHTTSPSVVAQVNPHHPTSRPSRRPGIRDDGNR